jgi:glucokinase
MAKKIIIGIDVGGTNLKVSLLDMKYNIRQRRILSTRRFIRKEKLIAAIVASIRNLTAFCHLKKQDILGVGLGLPGPVDFKKGIVHFLPNVPGWKEVRLKSILQSKLKLPVFVDNDVNLMTLAEYKRGAARGSRNALCLTLGTGVGGGIIINGNIYRGRDNATGEIGHLPINEKGPRCNCGGIACLETYIGNNVLLKDAKRLLRRNISLEELSQLAQKGNPAASSLWSQVACRLAVALVGAVNLLNPDCIVIGGGVANAGKALFARVRRHVRKKAMAIQGRRVKIRKAKLGSDAGLIGAAIMVRESLKNKNAA